MRDTHESARTALAFRVYNVSVQSIIQWEKFIRVFIAYRGSQLPLANTNSPQ